MDFKSEAQKACYEKVLPWMKEIFGEFTIVREDVPMIGVIVGSALTQVAVHPWGDTESIVSARAYLVTGAEMTPELLGFLLHENDNMRFGAFGVDRDNDIFFEHSIVGSHADKEELKASVLAVVYTADNYDDKIVERWGGERMLDRMRR